MNKSAVILFLLFSLINADEVFNLNKKANSLYKQEKYAEAIELYNKAIEISPNDANLHSNKGAAFFKIQQPQESVDAYKKAIENDTTENNSQLHYDLGNALNMLGDLLAQKGDQDAMSKFKEAKKSYIKSLTLNPKDMNSKWNLQITNEKIKQMEKQQQEQKDKENMKPSEYAKKIKAQADKQVDKRQYKKALKLMMDLLQKDETGQYYNSYIMRLKDASEINEI